jgi:transposase
VAPCGLSAGPTSGAEETRRGESERAARLRLFFLPAYSPEINPDEYLNQDVKSNALGRQRPRDRTAMLMSVRLRLWSRQREPALVRRYFQAPDVQYAA